MRQAPRWRDKMKKMNVIGTLLTMIFLVSACTTELENEGAPSEEMDMSIEEVEKEEPTDEETIQAQVANMSLEEKIGQLIIAGLDGTEVTSQAEALVDSYHVGGFIFFSPNLETPNQTVQLIDDVKKLNQKKDIPLFLSIDQEGGRVTRLPDLDHMKTNEEIGTTYDSDFSYQTGKLLAEQLHAYGLQVNFAPSLDINSNPQNTVIGDRAFSHNAEDVSEYGIQMMQGMQDENIITSIKHFPGHGDTHEDSHEALPVIEKTEEQLKQMELIPFQDAIDAGADMVMVAHILLPELGTDYPASMSKEVVTGLLRDEMNHDGVVITDDMTMGAIANHYGLAEASVLAIQAGVDIVLMAHGNDNIAATFEALKTAVEDGEITEERVDESVERILTLKQQYELEDTLVESVDHEKLNQAIQELYEAY